MNRGTLSGAKSEWSVYGLLLIVHLTMVVVSSLTYYRMLQQDSVTLGEALGLVFIYVYVVFSASIITLSLASIGLMVASNSHQDFTVLHTIKQILRWILSIVSILYGVAGPFSIFQTPEYIISYSLTFVIGCYSVYILLSSQKPLQVK